MVSVLLVDDDALFREETRRMLESADIQVTEASDGERAIVQYRAAPTDIVLCDIFMEGKEGFQTIRELRREFRTSRVIAMSAGDGQFRMNVLKMAMHMGAVDTIPKPFDQAALLDVIEKVMKSAV